MEQIVIVKKKPKKIRKEKKSYFKDSVDSSNSYGDDQELRYSYNPSFHLTHEINKEYLKSRRRRMLEAGESP